MTLSAIHPVIITRDAARTLAATLETLRKFPEIIVYDNGSSDDTLSIARSFSNAKVVIGEFIGFGPTKNRAAELAAGDWILSIDADESVSDELLSSLSTLELSERRQTFAVHRHNLLMPWRHNAKAPRICGPGGQLIGRPRHYQPFERPAHRPRNHVGIPLAADRTGQHVGPNNRC